MNDLYETLKRCAEWLKRAARPGQRVGEQNTKAAVIEPVLAALGWDVFDLDEVQREYRRLSTDNPVDYALLLMRTPRLFVEAKGVNENLDDPKWANQTISYATAAGVEWVALTNGVEWRLYNAHAPVPIEQKLFRSVRIDEDIEVAREILGLLSKEDMGDNRIEELWRSFFVDRQVHEALREIFSGTEPARELVNALTRRIPKLSKSDIRQSLIRVRASFDFPAAGTLPVARALPPARPVVAKTDQTSDPATQQPTRRAARQRVSSDERNLTLRDLVARGLVPEGATITTDYRNCGHTARVQADGSVTYVGTAYRSLSAAGEAVKIALLGPDIPASVRATDGWSFWRAEHPQTGELLTLKQIRARAASDQP
jgi:predicted type IV restriction endonuclease